VIQESFNLFLVIPQALGMARILYARYFQAWPELFAPNGSWHKSDQELSGRIYPIPHFTFRWNSKIVRLNPKTSASNLLVRIILL